MARPGFSDDALFSHALSKQRLAKNIIDLVAACVIQIFTFQNYSSATCVLCKSFCFSNNAGTSRVCPVKFGELCNKRWIKLRTAMGFFKFLESANQSFRHKATTVWTEVAQYL